MGNPLSPTRRTTDGFHTRFYAGLPVNSSRRVPPGTVGGVYPGRFERAGIQIDFGFGGSLEPSMTPPHLYMSPHPYLVNRVFGVIPGA